MIWRYMTATAKPAPAGRWCRETTTNGLQEALGLSHAISIRSGARTGRGGVIMGPGSQGQALQARVRRGIARNPLRCYYGESSWW